VNEPHLLEGGVHADERGEVGFVNTFDFRNIRRFYTLTHHRAGTVRAWHGHKVEGKYIFAVQGELLVCCVAVDDWSEPSHELPIQRFILSEHHPAVLHIPGGHANGLMSLTDESRAVVFSTASLDESKSDDIRFPARFWNPWSVPER
jgi:dTDP-4-dehydrorhamnose 3,5-epimerase